MTILNLCVVLYDCGIKKIHVGAIMRLMGVPDDLAQKHDDERLFLDEEFVKYVEQLNEPRSVDQALH
jgi:hypothetical protein